MSNPNEKEPKETDFSYRLDYPLQSMANVGFAGLFFTYSLAEQGISIGTTGMMTLSIAVAAVCFGCTINALVNLHKSENKHLDAFNFMAYLLATIGCCLLGARFIFRVKINALIAAALFILIATTVLLMLKHLTHPSAPEESAKNITLILCFFIQTIAIIALLNHPFAKPPSSFPTFNAHHSHHWVLTTITAIAGIAAIVGICIGFKDRKDNVQYKLNQPANQSNEVSPF